MEHERIENEIVLGSEDVESGSESKSDLDSEALDSLVNVAVPTSTARATSWGLSRFRDWLSKRSLTCDFHEVSPDQLNETLRKFYAEVKTQKKKALTPSALTGIRAAIHRTLISPPFNRNVNIVKDRQFTTANAMFTAKCKIYYKMGNKKPQHKQPIGDGDMQKLSEYFASWKSSPDVLVQAVWFLLCFHYGRRGREGWTSMDKDYFQVCVDSEGKKYLTSKTTEVTKNIQGGHKQCQQDYSDQRMYGKAVDIYEFYLKKLSPKCQRLFQNPMKAYRLLDACWFRNEPLGKTPMGSMMKRISEKAGLSHIYTCHSVRASTITRLFHAGVSAQSICCVTKHRNESSLKHYVSDMSTSQKRQCSNILESALMIDQSGSADTVQDMRETENENTSTGPVGSIFTDPFGDPLPEFDVTDAEMLNIAEMEQQVAVFDLDFAVSQLREQSPEEAELAQVLPSELPQPVQLQQVTTALPQPVQLNQVTTALSQQVQLQQTALMHPKPVVHAAADLPPPPTPRAANWSLPSGIFRDCTFNINFGN